MAERVSRGYRPYWCFQIRTSSCCFGTRRPKTRPGSANKTALAQHASPNLAIPDGPCRASGRHPSGRASHKQNAMAAQLRRWHGPSTFLQPGRTGAGVDTQTKILHSFVTPAAPSASLVLQGLRYAMCVPRLRHIGASILGQKDAKGPRAARHLAEHDKKGVP